MGSSSSSASVNIFLRMSVRAVWLSFWLASSPESESQSLILLFILVMRFLMLFRSASESALGSFFSSSPPSCRKAAGSTCMQGPLHTPLLARK